MATTNNPQTNRHIRGQALPKPEVCDCGHAPTPTKLSTGYARLSNNTTVCYECAADIDRRYAGTMTTEDRLTIYATPRKRFTVPGSLEVEFTTWAGVHLGYGYKSIQPGQNRAYYEGTIYTRTQDGENVTRAVYGYGPIEDGTYATVRPYKGR